MLYMPKITHYLKILTEDEMKDFVIIDFGEYFKSTREKLYSKRSEEKNLRKVVESFYSFLKMPDKVQKYVKLIEKMSEAKIMMQ